MCGGCSGASSVLCALLLCALLVKGRGRCAVTGGRVHAQATPTPEGVTVSAAPTSLDVAHTGSRADCSPMVRTLCLSAALQSVCQALTCRPHESSKCGTAALSWRGSVRTALPGLGSARRRCAVLPPFLNALVSRFTRYCRESQGSSRYCRSP